MVIIKYHPQHMKIIHYYILLYAKKDKYTTTPI